MPAHLTSRAVTRRPWVAGGPRGATRAVAAVAGLLVVLSSACAPVTAVVRSPATPTLQPTHPSEVRIYHAAADVPGGYRELGLVVANTHVFVPVMLNLDTAIAERAQLVRAGDLSDHPVLHALVRRAAALGADGVVVTGLFHSGTTFSLSGVAIRRALPPCAAPPPPAVAPPLPEPGVGGPSEGLPPPPPTP